MIASAALPTWPEVAIEVAVLAFFAFLAWMIFGGPHD